MSYEIRREPRHEKLRVRGLQHHVVRWGPASDDPVVLLHGWADTADTFQFMVDEFAADWPLAAFDWRGFGRTDWSPGGYWFPDYYADLDRLLDDLCPHGPVRLVGHSMGGHVALTYAGIRPARVRRVVSLEGYGVPPAPPEDAPGRLGRWLKQLREPPMFGEFASYDDLAHLLLRRNPRLGADRAAFVARSWAREAGGGGIRIVADPAHKRVNPYRHRRDEAEACWRAIAAPVLVAVAGRSGLLPPGGPGEVAAKLAELVADLRMELLPEAGHMLHHEQPAAVARLVEAFLGKE